MFLAIFFSKMYSPLGISNHQILARPNFCIFVPVGDPNFQIFWNIWHCRFSRKTCHSFEFCFVPLIGIYDVRTILIPFSSPPAAR